MTTLGQIKARLRHDARFNALTEAEQNALIQASIARAAERCLAERYRTTSLCANRPIVQSGGSSIINVCTPVSTVALTRNGNTLTATENNTATGNGKTYQWTINGSDITGATSATYNIPANTPDGSVFNCKVANPCTITPIQATTGITYYQTFKVSIAKTVSDATPDAGDTVTFTITLNKIAGLSNANDITVTETLPSGFTFGTPTLGNIVGNVWTIPAGVFSTSSASVTVTGTAPASGTVTNTATLATSGTDTIQGSNVASSNFNVNVALPPMVFQGVYEGDNALVSFNDLFLINPGISPKTLLIDWGDGSPLQNFDYGASQDAAHSYSAPFGIGVAKNIKVYNNSGVKFGSLSLSNQNPNGNNVRGWLSVDFSSIDNHYKISPPTAPSITVMESSTLTGITLPATAHPNKGIFVMEGCNPLTVKDLNWSTLIALYHNITFSACNLSAAQVDEVLIEFDSAASTVTAGTHTLNLQDPIVNAGSVANAQPTPTSLPAITNLMAVKNWNVLFN